MSPLQKLINITDKDLYYTISDLAEKAYSVGLKGITYKKIYNHVRQKKIKALQAGGKGCDYEINGQVFLDWVFTNFAI